jgi:outer membrane protein OmpA-like peptidoglycan-associated protein
MHAHLHRAARTVRRYTDSPSHTAPARRHAYPGNAVHHLQRVSGNTATSRLLTALRQPAAFDAPRTTFQNVPGTPANAVQRNVVESKFEGGGRVDPVRTGEHLVWNFDIGSSNLRKEHKDKLKDVAKEIVQTLKDNGDAELDLEGQASSTGTDVRNEALAKARAESVKQALVAEGVDSARIKGTSVGSAKSLEGATQEEFARSRAVRIILAPRLAPPTAGTPVAPTVKGCPPLPTAPMNPLDLSAGPVTLVSGVMRAGSPGGRPPGMLFVASPSFPPPSPKCARFLLVQNVQPFIEIVYKDRSRNRMEVASWHVDGDPYPCQNFGVAHQANDSPGFSVGNKQGIVRTIEIRHEFRMYYMVLPASAPRYSLEAGRWTWIAQARNTDPALDGGSIALDRSISRVLPTAGTGQPTNELPATSPPVSSAQFVTITGASSKKSSQAADHLTELNSLLKPKPPAKTCTDSSPTGGTP